MNKKIFFGALVIILLGGGIWYYSWFKNKKDQYGCLLNQGYYWCGYRQECVTSKKGCALTVDWILKEANKTIGLDINIMPDQAIKFTTKDGEISFAGKGIYYTDLLRAPKLIERFGQLNQLLQKLEFTTDELNPAIKTDGADLIKYKKDTLVCMVGRTDNPNQTSSLSLYCGQMQDVLCNFNTSCGRSCNTDTDCGLLVNGCDRKMVCRSRSSKFYNDCPNPTAVADDLDVSINGCACVNNQCVPNNEKLRSRN